MVLPLAPSASAQSGLLQIAIRQQSRQMTPESITPLERLSPYLLLISFSLIQFNGDIVLSFFQNVNTLFANFRYFFRAVYYACGNAPALDFCRAVCYTLSAECYCIEGGADNGRFEV